MKNAGLLTFLIITLSSFVFSQNSLECKGLLEGFASQMAKIELPEPGKMHSLHFSIQTVGNPGHSNLNTLIDIKITMTKEFYGYSSPQISVFADQAESFVIIHPQRLIVHRDQSYLNTDPEALDKAIELQRVLISRGQFQVCEERTKDNINFKYMMLKMESDFKKRHHIDWVEYWYDLKQDRLKEVIIHYSSTSDKAKQIFTYHEVKLNNRLASPINAKAYVFASNGHLFSKFQQYKVVRQ